MMEIEKPRITCEETDNGCFARFVVEPLDRGFGITLGNCMRRVYFLLFLVLLQSLLKLMEFNTNSQQSKVFLKMLLILYLISKIWL